MRQFLYVSIAMLLIYSTRSYARDHQLEYFIPAQSVINVKDHGAKGDGLTDDTRAIQQAVHAFYEQYQVSGAWVRNHRNARGYRGVVYHAHPQIVFPEGVYRISEPIVFRRYANVRGIGRAVIVQSNAKAETFYFHSNWQTWIENVTFRGGRTQLRIYTANNGGSQVTIDNCTFEDSSEYAVEHRSYTKHFLEGDQWTRSIPWPPYSIQWEHWKPTLTANDNTGLTRWANSTVFSISRATFDNCMGAVNAHADMIAIRDSHVAAHPESDGPVFDLEHGIVRLYRIHGTAHPSKDKDPYWIESRCLLAVRESTFETVGHRGMDFLRTSMAEGSWGWYGILLDQCRIDMGNSQHKALIWLAKGLHPNLLSVTRITEISGRPVQAVVWEDPSALEDPRSLQHAHGGADLQNLFSVYLADNSSNIDTTLPQSLEPYKEASIPREALEQSYVAKVPWEYRDLEAQTNFVIDATHVGEADSDHVTEQLQAVLDKAAQQENSLIILPGRKLKLSETLRVPTNVVMRASGIAVLIQEDPAKDIFHLDQPQQVGMTGLLMQGGRRALNVILDPDVQTRIALDNCWITDVYDAGIHAVTPDGKPARQAAIRFQRGQLNTTRGMVTQAGHTMIDESWMINGPHLHEQAFIENLAGQLRLQSVLGNPTVWIGERGKPQVEDVSGWPYGHNLRWVDNFGQFYSVDTRYGGESGGICNVFNRSPEGTIYIEGGITRSLHDLTRPAILFMEQDPAVTILRHISGVPVPTAAGLARILRPDNRKTDPVVFVQGVMVPAASAN